MPKLKQTTELLENGMLVFNHEIMRVGLVTDSVPFLCENHWYILADLPDMENVAFRMQYSERYVVGYTEKKAMLKVMNGGKK